MAKSQIEIENLRKALNVWDPNDHDVWTRVGMALKSGGYDFSVWDEWSRGSTKYGDDGNQDLMRRKWESFSDTERPGDFTVGSIFWKASRDGVRFGKDTEARHNEPFSLKDQIMTCDDYIASCYKDGKEVAPDTWLNPDTPPAEYPFLHLQPWMQLLVYLHTLYREGEITGIANAKYTALDHATGKWGPRYPIVDDASFVDTVKAYLTEDNMMPDVMERAIGKTDPDHGAWILLNSYKSWADYTAEEKSAVRANGGKGYFEKHKAVTFRYALIESDVMKPDDHLEMCIRLQLPIVTVTTSGGKSYHVIVRIDASSLEEYNARVAFLHTYLNAHGMRLDPNDKNVNRFTRIPGVQRGDKRQELILVGQMLPYCCKSWDEWERKARAEMAADTSSGVTTPAHADTRDGEKKPLPNLPVNHTQAKETPPPKDIELIEGLMLKGGIMEVIAPPKAGKTHFMMQMGMLIAQGLPFLGYKTSGSKVLYANMELTSKQFERRMFKLKNDIFEGQPDDIRLDAANNFLDMPLKGMALTMETFVDAVIAQWKGSGVDVIIIDPIYPLMNGDENGTPAWREAIKELDRLVREMGGDLSVIYVHHTTKGDQGNKSKRDQGAGSGMQTRHGDEIIALMELEVPENIRYKQGWDAKVKAYEMGFTSRDFDPDPKRIYFKDGVFYEDTDGILEGCTVIGSDEYNARKSADARAAVSDKKADARKAKSKAAETAMIEAVKKILSTSLPNGGMASEIAGELFTMPEGKGETLNNLRIQISGFATALPDTFVKETDDKGHVIIKLKGAKS